MKTIMRLCAMLSVLAAVSVAGGEIKPVEQRATVELASRLDRAVLPAGQAQSVFLALDLQPAEVPEGSRPPVNVAIVLDRSGSMAGDKIAAARQAAAMAVEHLAPGDTVSLVAYNHLVDLLVPAVRLATERSGIIDAIGALSAGGNTALFAGVSKGAAELRKFRESSKVNRVVLLSDGLANVGPSSPDQLAELGASLGREGIAVTTIGLGLDYDEDLMTRLAVRSQGNHFFARQAADLKHGFELEFGKGLAVVAQDVELEVLCDGGVKPLRVLNAEAELLGERVELRVNQLYSGRLARVLVELAVPAAGASEIRPAATVRLRYRDVRTGKRCQQTGTVELRFSDQPAEVAASRDAEIGIELARQVAMDESLRAVRLRDQGKTQDAQALLRESAERLKREAKRLGSSALLDMAREQEQDAERMKHEEKWKGQRKRMQTIQVIRLPSSGY